MQIPGLGPLVGDHYDWTMICYWTKCAGADNDNGLSIIDVTDPQSPAYCFLYELDGLLVNAEGYCDDDPWAVDALADIRLLTEHALNEA